MVAQNFQTLMQHALSLVQVGISIGGVVVIALHLKTSKWMWAILIGFLVNALVVVASAAMTFGIQMGTFAGGGRDLIGVLFLLIRSVSLIGSLLIVGGLWGVFSDIQRRLAT
jgi:hypothetical protein